MANNYKVLNSVGTELTFESIELGGVHSQVVYARQSGVFQVREISTDGTGGLTPYKYISVNTTNPVSVKGSAASLGFIVVTNNSTTNIAYVKLYNKATAPTVGTDIPVQVYAVPISGGLAITFPGGLAFTLGLAFAITNFMPDTDTGITANNQVAISLGYK